MLNLALVFPGQGSQTVGMLAELAEQHPIVRDHFSVVSDTLGYDLWHLVQNGPEAQLNQTEFTQAAMLTADVAVYALLKQAGLKPPRFMAGHSLGEYAALTAADALSLTDAATLVTQRGRLMQKYVPAGQGAMAAIVGLTDEQVTALCQKASTTEEIVTPANFNAIGQVVIAGATAAVERAVALAENSEAKLAKIIPVSVPCHCPLLEEAAAEFDDYLAKTPFKIPEIAVISNVDLSIYQSSEQIRALLKAQLYSPVRWVETIQMMKNKGVTTLIECGPGKVLSGLIKRIDKTLVAQSIYDEASLQQALSGL